MTQDRKPTYAEAARATSEDGDMDESFLGSQDEDEEWEDEDSQLLSEKKTGSRAPTYAEVAKTPPSLRKRRKGGARSGNRESRQSSTIPLTPNGKPPRPRIKSEDRPTISQEDVINGTMKGAQFAGSYALDVVLGAVHMLRKPLSWLLLIWFLALIIGSVSKTLQKALSPACILPGMSKLAMCGGKPTAKANGKRSQWADYPKLMDQQSKTFEQLMGDSVGGSALSLEIKHAEMATTDLVTLVKISNLKARDTLASSLTAFVDDAKRTGRGLQKLTSKVGGAVDNIIAVNDYALRSIEEARANQPSLLSAIVPWGPPRKNVNEIVTKTFEDAMDTLSSNIERLIIEAENNLQNLNVLEERLATIYEIVAREDASITAAQEELLAELWSRLGGNKKTKKNFENHLELLRGLGEYRKQALAHVVAALQTLRGMSEDMEDIRERVAAPNLLDSIPVEVHLKSIKMGLERMSESRIYAQKLQQEAVKKILKKSGPEDDDDNNETNSM